MDAERAELAVKTIEVMLLGGPLPEGFTVSSGVEQLVHSYICQCRKTERELAAKVRRLEATIDTLLERTKGSNLESAVSEVFSLFDDLKIPYEDTSTVALLDGLAQLKAKLNDQETRTPPQAQA